MYSNIDKLLNDKICVNIKGRPAEHASSTKLTDIASVIIPIIDKINLFSNVIFFILENIFFLFFSSTIF